MAALYADEQFPRRVVEILRDLGHDVLTVQEAGNSGLPDEEVVAFATTQNRAVLTLNRRHFIRLHQLQPNHPGIIVCSRDDDWNRQATRINQAISLVETLTGMLIRVNRPSN